MDNYKATGFTYLFTKRFFDIFLSFLGILLLSWLYIILIILVLIFSGIPVFYKDKRVGKNGKVIYVLKIRTMKKDANKSIESYLTPEELELWKKERKVNRDPRITKIGRILRKTSLDELPQFFNIFAGQMSIIGPRPITQKELDDNFSENEKKILLSTRPGLLSYWSLHGRNNVTYNNGERQKLELEYFKKRSIWFEIKMFFMAIPVVISAKGVK